MKSQRQAKILEIISAQNIETQEQLLDALQKEGFHGTQATNSRDIKELRIVKELTSLGTYRYTVANSEVGSSFSARLNTIFRECVTSFDYAQNMIVIHTLPGLASAAGSAIDAMDLSVILGCLAGDDTVMVVMRDTNTAAQFCGEISNLTCGCFCSYHCKHEFAMLLQLRETLRMIEELYDDEYGESDYFAAISKSALLTYAMDREEKGSIVLE